MGMTNSEIIDAALARILAEYIDEDKAISISLPRKRPFQMTMHCTRPHSASGNGSATTSKADSTPPTPEKAIADLRSTDSLDSYIKTRKSVWAVYAAAGIEVPREVEAAADLHRESLEERVS